jgi:hypothetical protein
MGPPGLARLRGLVPAIERAGRTELVIDLTGLSDCPPGALCEWCTVGHATTIALFACLAVAGARRDAQRLHLAAPAALLVARARARDIPRMV